MDSSGDRSAFIRRHFRSEDSAGADAYTREVEDDSNRGTWTDYGHAMAIPPSHGELFILSQEDTGVAVGGGVTGTTSHFSGGNGARDNYNWGGGGDLCAPEAGGISRGINSQVAEAGGRGTADGGRSRDEGDSDAAASCNQGRGSGGSAPGAGGICGMGPLTAKSQKLEVEALLIVVPLGMRESLVQPKVAIRAEEANHAPGSGGISKGINGQVAKAEGGLSGIRSSAMGVGGGNNAGPSATEATAES